MLVGGMLTFYRPAKTAALSSRRVRFAVNQSNRDCGCTVNRSGWDSAKR